MLKTGGVDADPKKLGAKIRKAQSWGVAGVAKKTYRKAMDNIKNAIIALLTGLLALSLFTQPAQSAPKTYDAVKLAQYSMCLNGNANYSVALMHVDGGNGSLRPGDIILNCKMFLP